MVSPQPIQLWRYIGFRKNTMSFDLKRLFYLSYEDALWDLLDKKKVKKNSTILVPQFFCRDVEENIKNHGYKVKYYKILDNLSVDLSVYKKSLENCNPSVVIVFYPVGIRSDIDINSINKNIIVIEDCVHQVLDLKNIKITRKNHFIIDSLRKVIPLQGSNLVGKKEDLDFNEPKIFQSFFYSLKVHILWVMMILGWNFGLYKFAEKMMIKGYDLIGDSILPAKGFWLFKFLFQFIDYQKISNIKYKQVQIYNKNLKSDIKFKKSDWRNLRGYPIGVSNKLLNELRKNKLLVRHELGYKIVYLPLGPHITHDKIVKICKTYQLASLIQV